MTRRELETLAEEYKAKADKALANYQETGKYQYYRKYSASDDLAEALDIAAQSADEHVEYIHLRADLSAIASKARVDKDKAVEELISLAESKGLIPKEQKGVIR